MNALRRCAVGRDDCAHLDAFWKISQALIHRSAKCPDRQGGVAGLVMPETEGVRISSFLKVGPEPPNCESCLRYIGWESNSRRITEVLAYWPLSCVGVDYVALIVHLTTFGRRRQIMESIKV